MIDVGLDNGLVLTINPSMDPLFPPTPSFDVSNPGMVSTPDMLTGRKPERRVNSVS